MEKNRRNSERPKILIVDDIAINVKVLANIVEAQNCEALCAQNVQEALEIMAGVQPQLILSDISMPGMDGLEFCAMLKSNSLTREIPVIFITVADSPAEKKRAFEAGAADFILKPFDRTEIAMRVNNQLNNYQLKMEMENYNRMMHKMVVDQKKQMEKERKNIMLAMVHVLKRRNPELGDHMDRVAHNSYIIAQGLQLIPQYENFVPDEFVETIGLAARLHDIGYLVMSDGVHTEEGISGEMLVRRNRIHTEEGGKILEEIYKDNVESRFLGMAIEIVKYHHAHWDGSGYPEGMEGTDIPLAARITALANDFDLMIEKNGMRDSGSVSEVVDAIIEKSGTYYDPKIVDMFSKIKKQLRVE